MMEKLYKMNIVRYKGNEHEEVEDSIIAEEKYTLVINGGHVRAFECTPANLEELAVGYALSQGMLYAKENIKELKVIHEDRKIELLISPSLSSKPGERGVTLSPESIYSIWEGFDKKCDLFKETGAAHGVGITDGKEIIAFKEDAARHNALLKAIGEAVLGEKLSQAAAIIFSGRVAAELVRIGEKTGIKILIAHGAATSEAVRLAEEKGITLCGFVKCGRMNVYSLPERIVSAE